MRALRCRFAIRPFLDLIVTTGFTNCRWICRSVNLRQLKQTGSGVSSVWDCEAINRELGSIDWHGIFSRQRVVQCTDLL
jgi:hypothetical protein